MITIPVVSKNTPEGCFDMVIVLERDNIDRLIAADPAEIDMQKFPPQYRTLRINRILIACESTANIIVLSGLAARGDVEGMIQMLLRGWKFQPERGDNDEPYKHLA